MFDEFTSDDAFDVPVTNPARQRLIACGYDKHCYISTARLLPYPYTTQALVEAAIGGEIKLIEACDDEQPPVGDMVDSVLMTFNSVVQNVTTEINGYLSSIYPCPLAQTGTVCVLKVSEVDDNGAIVSVEILDGGRYATAPETDNSPAYLRYVDPLANENVLGLNTDFQQGADAELTLTLSDLSFADESGQTLTANTVSAVAVADGGSGYQLNELLVVVGGASYVPAKVRQAALDLICHALYKRRLAPDEKNPFSTLAAMWRKLLLDIGHGEQELDGTYKRSFSVGAAWVTKSIIGRANSL